MGIIDKISRSQEICEGKILLVEGNDEENFFGELIKVLDVDGIQIVNCGGEKEIKPHLKALKNQRDFDRVDSIGIIKDADEDTSSAFDSITKALKDAGLPIPDTVLKSAGDKPKVTIMILPDGKLPGMLEDLCLTSVKADPAMPCVENYFTCLENQDIRNPENMSKAKVKVYLASKPVVVPHLGIAATKGYWPLEDSTFDQVKQFIKAL